MLGFSELNRVLSHSFGAVANIAEAAEVSTGVLVTITKKWEKEQMALLSQLPPPPPRSRNKAAAP
jgi:hypothetical protein